MTKATLVAMQDGDTAFEGETLFARVTGIEVKNPSDGFAERFVRVAKQDDVRSLSSDALFQFIRKRVWIDDVVYEKLSPTQLDHLGEFQIQKRICIAEDRSYWRDICQFEQQRVRSDVAAVQDVIHAVKQF